MANYSIIKIISEAEKQEMIQAIENNDFNKVSSLLPQEIHIGKLTYGWKFCFDHNNWQFFDKSIESMKKFISKCKIFDEYDTEISNYDFWKMVEMNQLGRSHEFYQGQRYGFLLDGYNFSESTGFS